KDLNMGVPQLGHRPRMPRHMARRSAGRPSYGFSASVTRVSRARPPAPVSRGGRGPHLIEPHGRSEPCSEAFAELLPVRLAALPRVGLAPHEERDQERAGVTDLLPEDPTGEA